MRHRVAVQGLLLALAAATGGVARADNPPGDGPAGDKPAAAGPAAGASVPAPPEEAPLGPVRSGFDRVADPSETVSIDVPHNYVLEEVKTANRVLTMSWKETPWMHLRVQVYAYEGQHNPEHFRKHMETLGAGTYKDNTIEYLTEDKSRFIMTPQSDAMMYQGMFVLMVRGKIGYGLWLSVNRKLFQERRDDLDYIAASFRAYAAPVDSFTVPDGWHVERTERFVIMGPVDAAAPKDVQEKQRLRIAQVRSWVDNEDGPLTAYRAMFEDRRKFMARRVIHVHADPAAYQAALGANHVPGRNATYDFAHADRPVVVNGHPESGVTQKDVLIECGPQYVESRTGPLPPWIRLGLRGYFEGGVERGFLPCMNYRMLEKAKDLFRRKPPKYADVAGATDEQLRALGDAGAVAAWAFVYFRMRGPDDAHRRAWNEWQHAAVKTRDAAAAWKAAHPKDDARRIDSETAKWLREEKLPDK